MFSQSATTHNGKLREQLLRTNSQINDNADRLRFYAHYLTCPLLKKRHRGTSASCNESKIALSSIQARWTQIILTASSVLQSTNLALPSGYVPRQKHGIGAQWV